MASEEIQEQIEEVVEEVEETVAKKELKIDLEIDEKKTKEAMKTLEEAFGGIKKRFESISASIRKTLNSNIKAACDDMKKELEAAFTITNPEEYEAAAARFGDGVAGALLSANENMEALQDSVVNTAAPLAGAVASIMNEILPSVTGLVSNLKQTISDAITGVQPLITWLWDSFLQPVAQWTGGVIVETLQSLASGLGDISDWIQENMALVEGIILVVGSIAAAIGLVNAVTGIWNVISATGTVVTSALGAAMSVLTSPITLVVAAIAAVIAIVVLLIKNWDTVKEVAVKTWNAIVDAFGKAGDWFKRAVLDPVVDGFKGAANGVVGFINGLISGVVKGINSIINLINKLNFTVPDWIPGIGGETFGFNITPLTAPQIPYLAKGAVLPANRPFLAVVGDQKYGTNVEAPLATIQEAVALTMEDFTAGNMAGHQATVEVHREILEAVLGIHIGDGDIARAVDRYRRKMAVVHGGNW